MERRSEGHVNEGRTGRRASRALRRGCKGAGCGRTIPHFTAAGAADSLLMCFVTNRAFNLGFVMCLDFASGQVAARQSKLCLYRLIYETNFINNKNLHKKI